MALCGQGMSQAACKMGFLPKLAFIAFGLYQFLPNRYNAEPTTADFPSPTKGFLSASLQYFALHRTDLELAKKLQHSQLITTLWLSWVWVSLVAERGRERMRRVNKGPLATTASLTKPTKQPNFRSEVQTPQTPSCKSDSQYASASFSRASVFPLVWAKQCALTTRASLPVPASLSAHIQPRHRSLERSHSTKAITDLPVYPTLLAQHPSSRVI